MEEFLLTEQARLSDRHILVDYFSCAVTSTGRMAAGLIRQSRLNPEQGCHLRVGCVFLTQMVCCRLFRRQLRGTRSASVRGATPLHLPDGDTTCLSLFVDTGACRIPTRELARRCTFQLRFSV